MVTLKLTTSEYAGADTFTGQGETVKDAFDALVATYELGTDFDLMDDLVAQDDNPVATLENDGVYKREDFSTPEENYVVEVLPLNRCQVCLKWHRLPTKDCEYEYDGTEEE